MTRNLPKPLWIVLAAGLAMRLIGLTQGVSNESTFHKFHPDEVTLVEAALKLNAVDPPLTTYGLLPMYLLRGGVEVAHLLGLGPGDPILGVPFAFLLGRCLAALFSTLTVWLTWRLATQVGDGPTGMVAASMVTFAPMAIQQAHFYTVDSLFSLLCTAALLSILVAVDSEKRFRLGLAGALIAGASAVRVIGCLLLVPLVIAHLAHPRWRGRRTAALRDPGLAIAAVSAVLVLILLQPYLILNPETLLRTDTHHDLLVAVEVARGELSLPWTLADGSKPVFLHHWLTLFPLGVGWPLTLLFAAGLVHASRRYSLGSVAMLTWSIVYFLSVGGLHSKPVRYLLPLLPVLSVLASCLCVEAWTRSGYRLRSIARLALGAALAYSVGYGLAFTRLYWRADTRIEAASWMRHNLAPGTGIALETGAFTLRPLLDPEVYRIVVPDFARLVAIRDYLSCSARLTEVERWLGSSEYLAIIDVNRAVHCAAMSSELPVFHTFYGDLLANRAGLELVQRFQVRPMGSLQVDETGDPSFTGYDHPTVLVYRRMDTEFADVLRRWRERVASHADCIDGVLEGVAHHLRLGNLEMARALVTRRISIDNTESALHLVRAEVHRRAGLEKAAYADLDRYRDGYLATPLADQIPWATATTMVHAGLPAIAILALQDGVAQASAFPTPRHILHDMAASYREIAALLDPDHPAEAGQARSLAAELVRARQGD